MFLFRRPSPRAIQEFLATQKQRSFSYPEVGATHGSLPSGYTIDHNRALLGHGAGIFQRAVESVHDWRMFDLGWVQLFPKDASIERGATVAVLVHHLGFWSLNASRVVYVFQEERCFGFAYGTLEDHAEQGEERFSIEWSDDDSVWYEILAFSRPRQWQAKIALPLSRALQKRFARDSKAAMVQASSEEHRVERSKMFW